MAIYYNQKGYSNYYENMGNVRTKGKISDSARVYIRVSFYYCDELLNNKRP